MRLKSAYAKGYRNEKRSREFLEKLGYYVVEARGSHGLWDLVAIHHGGTGGVEFQPDVVLVQVKSNRKPSGVEMSAMAGLRLPEFVTREVHIWHDRQPKPEVLEVK